MFEGLLRAVAELAAADVSVAPSALGDEICALYQVRDALEAQIARRLAAFARTDGWADEQVTVGAWLRTQTTMSHGQTAAQTRVARAQEQLPELAACWQAGRISFAHWQAVVAGLRLLPEELWADVDAPLATAAPSMTARELGDYLRRLAEALLPTPKPKDETQREARRLSVTTGFNGMTVVSGRLTPEVGEKLQSALSAASRPDAAGELRLPNQRKADALEQALDLLLDSGALPEDGGQKPHVNLIVGLDSLTVGAQLAEHDPTRAGSPLTRLSSEERAQLIRTVTDRLDAERAGTTPVRPRLSWTGPIGVSTARRLVCDGAVTPVFTRGSKPFDVGRTSRDVPAHLRSFVVARDGHCIWPSCSMPARWCHAHHLWFWADGGPTNADTLGLLCPHHHTAAHSGRWTVVVTAPGVLRIEKRTRPDQPLYRFEYDIGWPGKDQADSQPPLDGTG